MQFERDHGSDAKVIITIDLSLHSDIMCSGTDFLRLDHTKGSSTTILTYFQLEDRIS